MPAPIDHTGVRYGKIIGRYQAIRILNMLGAGYSENHGK